MSPTDPSALTTHTADALVRAVLTTASQQQLRVSVAVVDGRGFDLVVVRGDGATWFTPEVARAKARTATAFGRPSDSLAAMRAAYPDLFDLVGDGLPFRPTELPGGLPVEVDGRLMGAIGVSGARPDQDVTLARGALTAVLGQ